MPLAIRRLVGAWFGEDKKLQVTKYREQQHVLQNIEFVKNDPDMIKAKGRHLVVGKSKDCDIILDNSYVTEKHLEITEHRIDQWYVKDLGSETGTYIEREKSIVKLLSGEFKIEAGDKLVIGNPNSKSEPATYLEIMQA